LCAFCIRDLIAARKQSGGRSRWVTALGSIAAAISALVLSWGFFYFAGQLLGRLSDAGGQ
jgi:ABC-type Fe3+ transport system permease subunit